MGDVLVFSKTRYTHLGCHVTTTQRVNPNGTIEEDITLSTESRADARLAEEISLALAETPEATGRFQR